MRPLKLWELIWIVGVICPLAAYNAGLLYTHRAALCEAWADVANLCWGLWK